MKKDPPPVTKPPGEGNQSGGQDTIVDPADSLDADVVSQYLKLVNATKVTGQPPEGVDGLIYNDVKDSIFLMRGLPVGDRIRFLHDPAMNVTGFYVYVPGASYYYDVPNVPEVGTDSTDVVYVDAEFPVADFKDYPISFPIQIMPYVDNIPFKPFIETVVIEDAHDPDNVDLCDNILGKFWQWEFTIRLYKGEIRNFWAPGIRVGINTLLGGCCTQNGTSITNADPGGAGCKKIDTGPGMTWVEFPSYDGTTSLFEYLRIYPDNGDGEFITIVGAKDAAMIVPESKNFCTKTVDRIYTYNSVLNEMEASYYNAVKGLGTLGIPLQIMNQPNVSFLQAGSYNVEYTCNSMLLERGDGEGEEWGYVYKKMNYDELYDFRLEWHDYENNPYNK